MIAEPECNANMWLSKSNIPDKEYKLYTSLPNVYTLAAAQDLCMKCDGELASITSAAERDLLYRWVTLKCQGRGSGLCQRQTKAMYVIYMLFYSCYYSSVVMCYCCQIKFLQKSHP